MPYVNPGQLLQEYFQPTVRSVLPIVPSLMVDRRADMAERIATQKWLHEAPLREAQSGYYNQKAREAEIANQAYSKLLGGSGEMMPLGGVKPEAALAHKYFGTPYETMKPIHQPSTVPGQPGKTVYGYPKIGDEVRSDTEPLAKLDYWVKGPQGWKQTSEQVPKETWNQRIKEVEAQGGQMNEPPEIKIQSAVDQFNALAPLKMEHLTAQLKAKGIDTTKFNQQQRLWVSVVESKARRRTDVIKTSILNFKDMNSALDEVEDDVFKEMQRIAQGQPPTYLTPPEGAAQPGATPGPIPMAPKGQPQSAAGAPPASKLKEGVVTTFKNGQSWTLENGQPKQVK